MTREYRIPGPLGLSPGAGGGRLPGPLNYGHGPSGGQTQVGTAAAKHSGITVNAASEIAGAEWEKLLRASTDLPEFITSQVRWVNGSLTTAEKFKVPTDTVTREWLPDFVAAFERGGWELSTCHLEVTARGDSSSQQITVIVVPHLSKDERLGRATPVKDTYTNFQEVVLTFGWTFPAYHAPSETGALLKSHRGLILVANRIVLTVGDSVQTLRIGESEMVETLTHEAAVHAGRANLGLSDLHGDETVERRTREIREEFKKPGIKSIKSTVYDLIEQFYKKETKKEQTKP
jgi:hypothetical protein